jgi:flagellar basal body P-ring formation protein FlgA
MRAAIATQEASPICIRIEEPNMRRILKPLICCAIGAMLSTMACAQAVKNQSAAAIQKAVDNFLRTQTAGLPGKVTYTIGAIDTRVVLPACPALDVYLPSGARLWGQTSVGVRCSDTATWNIYVSAEVRVAGEYLVTARPLPNGQLLTTSDLVTQTGDLTQLPAGILTEPKQAVGKILAASLAAGQPVRQDLLRSPLVVRQGQTVKLQSSGQGFQVTAEGRALNNAQDGQVAQVQTASGHTVSGVARSGGVVEITF